MKYWFQLVRIVPGQPGRRRFVAGRSQIFGPFSKMLQLSTIEKRPGVDLRVGEGSVKFDPKMPNAKVQDGADLIFWNADGWMENYDDNAHIYSDVVIWATEGDDPGKPPYPWTEEFEFDGN